MSEKPAAIPLWILLLPALLFIATAVLWFVKGDSSMGAMFLAVGGCWFSIALIVVGKRGKGGAPPPD